MKISKTIIFYSQHLIGVGHHFRNREIACELARNHRVVFVDGGREIADVSGFSKHVEIIRLEPIFSSNQGLTPIDTTKNIDTVLQGRQNVLQKTIQEVNPDILVIEFFPFDRWELYDELVPAIQMARSVNRDVKIICSLRDIPLRADTSDLNGVPLPDALVENGKFRFYSVPNGGLPFWETLRARQYYGAVCPTLNAYFDLLLVHADPKITTLDEHFPWVNDIEIPVEYTGYVSEKLEKNGSDHGEKFPRNYVLVSVGGGIEGYRFIKICIESWKALKHTGGLKDLKMVIFTGPFISNDDFTELEALCDSDWFVLSKFSSHFLTWIQRADFSISRAGYNTCMNILESKTPALLVPSVKMGDQVFRAERLAKLPGVNVISEESLNVQNVSETILNSISKSRITHDINLNGAETTSELVSNLITRKKRIVSMRFNLKSRRDITACIVSFQYPPMVGGVGIATKRIVRNLSQCGIKIHVIAPGQHELGTAISTENEDGVVVHRTFPDLSDYYGGQRELHAIGDYIKRLHQKYKFNIIHGMFLNPSGFVAANVATEMGCPFIASIHGSDWEVMRYNPLLAATSRWVLEQANLVTACAQDLLNKAKSAVCIEKGLFIPNSFDPTTFDSLSLKELQSAQSRHLLKLKGTNHLIIGTVAMIAQKKGHKFLFEAFFNILHRYPNTILLVVGDFHTDLDKAYFSQQIQELGLEKKILITGKVAHEQVLAWVNEVDIFVFPSLHEGSSQAVLEAMACGRPIVASGVGGILDLINHEENGFLVESGDTDALVNGLTTLIDNPDVRTLLGQNAMSRVKKDFMPIHETQKWLSVYEEVLGISKHEEANS